METGNTADSRVIRVAAWLIILSVTVFCLVYFSSFLQPIVIAGMVWYAVFELKRSIQKIKIKGTTFPNWLSTSLAFIIMILAIVGIYEIVVVNLRMIINRSDLYIANFREMIISLQTSKEFELVKEKLVELAARFDIQPVLTAVLNSLTSLAGNLFIIIIYVAFLLVEEKFFGKKLELWVKEPDKREKINHILSQIVSSVRKYIVVKTQMSLLTGLLSYFILILFKVDFAVWWAFLIFLLNYIPYIGSFFCHGISGLVCFVPVSVVLGIVMGFSGYPVGTASGRQCTGA